MIIKLVVLFLAAIAVLAMFGRYRFPGQKTLEAAKCPRCGRFKIGKGPCSCQKDIGK